MNRHWAQRCNERGLQSVCAATLAKEIQTAVLAGDDERVQFVLRTPSEGGRAIYRFSVEGIGIFYAVCDTDGAPITVLTRDMLRHYKHVRKGAATSLCDAKHQDILRDSRSHYREKKRRKTGKGQKWNWKT